MARRVGAKVSLDELCIYSILFWPQVEQVVVFCHLLNLIIVIFLDLMVSTFCAFCLCLCLVSSSCIQGPELVQAFVNAVHAWKR